MKKFTALVTVAARQLLELPKLSQREVFTFQMGNTVPDESGDLAYLDVVVSQSV